MLSPALNHNSPPYGAGMNLENLMAEDFLYEGEIRSTEYNLPVGQRAKVKLRMTKLLWIDEKGRRFRKSDGAMVETDQPPYFLRVATIARRHPELLKSAQIVDDTPPPIQASLDLPEPVGFKPAPAKAVHKPIPALKKGPSRDK